MNRNKLWLYGNTIKPSVIDSFSKKATSLKMIASHYIAHFVPNRITPNGKPEVKKMKLSRALKYQASDRRSFDQIGKNDCSRTRSFWITCDPYLCCRKIFFSSSLCAVKLWIQFFLRRKRLRAILKRNTDNCESWSGSLDSNMIPQLSKEYRDPINL